LILLDTSGLLSALFADQNKHQECAKALLEAEPPRILSPFVLAELDYLILKYAGVEAELRLMEEIERGVYQLASFDRMDIQEARFIVNKYRSLRIGLADASIIVLADRLDTRDVLTLDERHFRAVRPTARRSFRILPADAA
jgi:predicted nucleic acid-binding protein